MKIDWEKKIGINITRTCPRCRKRLWHKIWGKHLIHCAACGHTWNGRITLAEVSDVDLGNFKGDRR